MKNLFLLATFLISILACRNTTTETIPDDYTDYYELVNKAQNLAFSEDKPQEAMKLLKQAFAIVDHPFGQDLADALDIGLTLNDLDFAYTISKELAQRGCPYDYFLQKRYKALQADSKRWKMFATNYELYRNYFYENFDMELRKELRKELFELKTLDSTYNAEFHSKPLEIDYMVAKTKEISEKYLDFEKRNQFPSEAKVGLKFRNGKIVSLPSNVVLIHQYQRGDTIFQNRLDKMIALGMIHRSGLNALETMRGSEKGIAENAEMS